MQLIRKIGFYVFVACSIAVAVFGYFKLKETKEPDVSVLEHIPADVSYVMESKDFSGLVSKLTRQNLIWNHLLSNTEIQVTQNGINYLDSLISVSPDINQIVSSNSIYWAVIQKNNLTEHLILFKLKEKNNAQLINNFLEQKFTKDNDVSSFDAFFFTNNKQKWLVCCNNGIVYLSSDFALLQDCITLDKQKSLSKNINYTELLKENGQQIHQLYINHSFTNIISSDIVKGQSLLNTDVQLDKITLTGFNVNNESSFLNCLKRQKSGTISGYQFLPSNPDIIEAISISNAQQFYTELEKLQTPDIQNQNKEAWKLVSDSALYNIKLESYDNIDNEMISVLYTIDNIPHRISTIKLKDTQKTIDFLKLISDSISLQNDINVYSLNAQYGNLFLLNQHDVKKEFACIHNNALVLFSSQVMMQYYLNALNENNFLGKNTQFMSYAEDNLSLECNYIYYENHRLINAHRVPSALNLANIKGSENAITHLSITAKDYQNKLQLRINTQYQVAKENQDKQDVLWSFVADSALTNSPQLFINHLTQENEICFQDKANQLYLISSTGNLIWKKIITEPIQSKIYTVDVFKNGKFQLLFNTEHYLHLIDRNGNDVQGYPVKLPSKVTSNITLLDYENKKDYRIFFACADKHIYNYTLYGIKTEGFIPVKTEDEVRLPISYARVGASDYLITADVGGKIYGFSRKGEGRIDFKNKTIENLEHLIVLSGNNLGNSKLVYVDDKNNLLNKISLSDVKETIKIGDELNGYKTSFALINDDAQTDLFLYGNGAIYAYDLFGVKLFEYFNEQAVYNYAQLIQGTNRDVVLAYDKTNSKLNILDVSGKLVETINDVSQYPLATKLYKNEKNYLLKINRNTLVCTNL